MSHHLRPRHAPSTLATAAALFFALGLLAPSSVAVAQVSGGPDVNVSKLANYQNECAIANNPTNKMELFAACNHAGAGLFAARSTDRGTTWTYPDPTDKTLADGDPGQGPLACCDPTLSWDVFGNLYFGYLDSTASNVVVLLSTDSGLTFSTLATFAGSVDQPTVVATDNIVDPSPSVWVVWNQSGQMRARGASVTGLGSVGAFGALQTIPGTFNCSFGDVAISPAGAVVQVCQNPTGGQGPGNLLVNTDPDGVGGSNFGSAVIATSTNVGGFDFIPPQNTRSVDAEAGLAYDSFDGTAALPGFPGPSPHFGRLYLVYTDETVNENHDTDIMVRFSDDDGATWSSAIRVNDDPASPIRSQFLPKISTNPLSGNVAVCWHDARNSATNTQMEEFCSMATPTGATPTFFANAQIGDALSSGSGSSPPVSGQADIQFGDYSGLAYFQGRLHPIWADDSNSTGDNPDGAGRYDAYTDRVTGGPAANEGDPHLTTVEGVRYDFQSAGEFVALRGDGLVIQTRQTAIATSFFPGPNPYTGLATCVSLNTAVAAQVGKHRVTYQPNLNGIPDPSGLQLRVDGALTTVPTSGIDLGDGGAIHNTSATGGLRIDFPNGTILAVTPGWWASQSKWYLNVNAYQTTASEGLLGVLAPGSWLPALPDGSSLGPRPVPLPDRYVKLYEDFADAWRVDDDTTLFDYAAGTSTEDFTLSEWPKQSPPCEVPEEPVADPLDPDVAEAACAQIQDRDRREDCVYDVTVTGEVGFVETYLRTEEVEAELFPEECAVDEDFESGATEWFNDPASTCLSGAYVLGAPTQVTNGGVTTQVGGTSSGLNAIFTAANTSAGVDDVDGGNCILTSPAFAVPSASRLSVAYFHGQRDAGDDPGGDFFSLDVSTDGGLSWTPIASIGDATSNASWTNVSTSIPPGSSVVLRVQCSDGAAAGDLVECGIDDVSICEAATNEVPETGDST